SASLSISISIAAFSLSVFVFFSILFSLNYNFFIITYENLHNQLDRANVLRKSFFITPSLY
ncbi:MAG TPA: hypothetical protein QKA37_02500, partial [Candidatus Megaira endosymbiont of Stentor roeselii]|nr:hypothetical protein [Candidatus Megaera endosymbiont of Stentor roeselii]